MITDPFEELIKKGKKYERCSQCKGRDTVYTVDADDPEKIYCPKCVILRDFKIDHDTMRTAVIENLRRRKKYPAQVKIKTLTKNAINAIKKTTKKVEDKGGNRLYLIVDSIVQEVAELEEYDFGNVTPMHRVYKIKCLKEGI